MEIIFKCRDLECLFRGFLLYFFFIEKLVPIPSFVNFNSDENIILTLFVDLFCSLYKIRPLEWIFSSFIT